MKKINYFLFVALLSVISLSASAKIIKLVAGNNVGTTLTAATTLSGDTIELSEVGTYVWNAQASIGNGSTSFAPKSITIRAAAGLATRPVVQCQAAAATILTLALYKTDGSIIVLDGIDFDGNNKASFLWTVKSYNLGAAPVAPKFNISINNCNIRNFAPTTSSATFAHLVSYSASAPILAPGFLSVSNTSFENLTSSAFFTNTGGKPDSLNFTNCYFKGTFAKSAINNTGGTSGAVIRKIVIDHCTFNGGTTADLNLYNISSDLTSTTSISNCLFLNNTGSTANVLGTGGNLATKCGVFGATNAATVYPTAVADTAITTDPALNVYGYTTTADYAKTATDGKAIGFSPILKATVTPASSNLVYGTTQQYAVTISDAYSAFIPTISSTAWSVVASGTSSIDAAGLLTAGNANETAVKVNATATTIYGDYVATPASVNVLATTGLKTASAKSLTVSQSGSIFNVTGVNSANYSAYSVNGAQVAAGQIVNGQMNLNLNKGIYLLKVNGQVVKFAVR